MSDSEWQWSPAAQDYYRVVTDASGNQVCLLRSQIPTHNRQTSHGQGNPAAYGSSASQYGYGNQTSATPQYGANLQYQQVSYTPGYSTTGHHGSSSGSYDPSTQYAPSPQYQTSIQHASSRQYDSGGSLTPTQTDPQPGQPGLSRLSIPDHDDVVTAQESTRAARDFRRYQESVTIARSTPDIRGESGNRRYEEELDPGYKEQKNPSRFFKRGRVFAVLHVELLGNTTQNLNSRAIYTSRFGQKVYATIRRFIVIRRSREHCEAVPINTYSGRATTKPGVDPSTHGQVYIGRDLPALQPMETTLGCNPIRINPTSPQTRLFPESRINYDVVHTVQFNVRVKDIGRVCDEDIRTLVACYKRIRDGDDEEDDEE